MSGRYLPPIRGRIFAICVAATSLATWHVAPAFASSTAPASCDDPENSSLEIPAEQLHATQVSHEPETRSAAADRANETDETLATARYLTPEAEAVAEPPPEDDSVEDGDTQPAIKARVPGVSESDLARYKRHMYRRDI